jgi:hypothetical protein
MDDKGYMVTEDYSSYEEYEIPTRVAPVKKEAGSVGISGKK